MMMRSLAAILAATLLTPICAHAQNRIAPTLDQILFGTPGSPPIGWLGHSIYGAAPCPLPIEVDADVHSASCSQFTTTDATIARQAAEITNCDYVAHNAAEAVCKFFTAVAESGAPNAWIIAAEIVMKPGSKAGTVAELDVVNENADCGDLMVAITCTTLTLAAGADGIGNGRAGTFANTTAFLVQGSGTGTLWHTGYLAYGFGAIDGEAFGEVTDAFSAVKLAGSHHIGVDCFFGTYSEACLRLNDLQKIVLDPLRGVPSIYSNNGVITLSAAQTTITGNVLASGYFTPGTTPFSFGDTTNGAYFQMLDPGGSAADFLQYQAATAGNFGAGSGFVTLQCVGTDTNCYLNFPMKGSGTMIFNSAGQWTANGSGTLSLAGTAPSGCTAVAKWLTVKDNTGATLRIPAC